MHPYLPPLLNDIFLAHRDEIPETALPDKISFEEEMEEIERWIMHEEPEHTFGLLRA